MADIRINALATTAASTASDDFIAVDGSANGTRKLNAYSPTFGGNVVATGTLTVNSTTDSSSKDTGAIITEGGMGVEKSATIGGNLTVSGGSIGVGGAVGSYLDILQGGNDAYLYNRRAGPLIFGTNNTTALTLSSAQNATLAGNLTVSGTGTSSVAGLFDANQGLRAVSAASFSASTGKGVEMLYISTSDIGYLQSYDRTGSAYKLLNIEGSTVRINSGSGGNLLLGTTTDNGFGKLQSNGPISAVAASTHVLDLSGRSSDNLSSIRFSSNNTVTSYAQIFANSSGSLGIATGSGLTTALTLDSSQNATFAGNITVSGTTVGIGAAIGSGLDVILAGVDGYLYNRKNGYLIFGTNNTTALTLDNSQNATFAGNIKTAAPSGGTAATWRLGTVATVSPTSPNRTIEVQIGATTYYISAKTTND